jgi:uncharacterized membrane protein YcaP (DUF421 family)
MFSPLLHLPVALADAVPPQDGSSMWLMSLQWWEFLVRAVVVYTFLLVVLRISGKRQIGQLAPFDLVLLLVLSNSVQNSMNGGDNSVLAGVISATTLLCLNALIGWMTYRSKRLEGFIEGHPRVLIHNGKLYPEALRHEKLTHHELMSALRTGGCSSIEEVRSAILEPDGQVTVIPRTHAQ